MKIIYILLLFQSAFSLRAMENTSHNNVRIPLKSKYVQRIKEGLKTIEGRINSGIFKQIQLGDNIIFYSGSNEVKVAVIAKRRYDNFEQMIRAEGVTNLLPDVKTISKAVQIYESFPGYSEKVRRYGAVALQLKLKD